MKILDTEEKTLRLEEKESAEYMKDSLLIGASSVLGTRKTQQDSFYVTKVPSDKFAFAIVCDGMGGLAGGELASSSAIVHIKEQVNSKMDIYSLKEAMHNATISANAAVRELRTEEGTYVKCGTTMVAVSIKEGKMNWLSVGDSKIYLLRGNVMSTLTNEHNYKFMASCRENDNSFIFNQDIRPDALVSFLGAESLTYIDINPEPMELLDGDTVILCSDGLYKSLTEEQIKVIFSYEYENLQKAAEFLTTAATMEARVHQDNTTVIVLKYKNI